MSKYDRLKKQSEAAFAAAKEPVGNRDTIADELHRVSQIVGHAGDIISDLDRQFSQCTKLNGTDIAFLFLATALQCARQYIFSNEKFRLDNKQGDALMANFVPKKWENILLSSVPYDAFFLSPDLKDQLGSIGISGKTHRYRTLGHDPILGWVFGPMNILSDSLTKTDFISTYQVAMPYVTSQFPGGTAGAFQRAGQQIAVDKFNLPAAVTRQALHFGSDYFTKQGLPIPFLSTVDNDLSGRFLQTFHIDMLSITRGAALAVLINKLIACIHRLFYDEQKHGDPQLFEVKTRKILSYSNSIASGSNMIYVALSRDLSKLDVGGMLVTLYRLITDYNFIQKVKSEFIEEKWYDLVMGDELTF